MTTTIDLTDHAAISALAESKGLYAVRVTYVHHWTETLFTFRVERPGSFRFRSGEFVMIGLPGEGGKPVLRAYSIASPSWEEHLEFFSIKVQGGALTGRLQHLQLGDTILLGRKPTGTLVIDSLLPGGTLCMVGTGTGLAPFLSVLRDPDTHEKFERIVVTHTVRQVEELAYRQLLENDIQHDEIFGEALRDRFHYYPTVTRGDFRKQGRITDLIASGEFRRDLGIDQEDPLSFRFMLCGSLGFNKDMAAILEDAGLHEGTHALPDRYVMERAFVG
jgi:ferredoxin--NADP+ reductase